MELKTNSVFRALFGAFFKVFFLRSKESVFWLTIFPTLLFIILTTIFGNIEENVELKIKILGQSNVLKNIFQQVKQLDVEFINYNNNDQEEFDKTIEYFKHELERGNIDLLVIIPNDFDIRYTTTLLLRKTKILRTIPIKIYNVSIRDSSKLAKDILLSIIESINKLERIEITEHRLSEHVYNYNDFIYPGVIGMAILSVFLFGFINDLEYINRKKVIRRFLITPTNIVYTYIIIAVVNVIELFVGVLLLSIFANFKGVKVIQFLPNVIFNLLLSSVVMILLSITILSFVKNPSFLFGFTQIFFQVQMFVGGFYIPLKFTPNVVRGVAMLLPITYTVDNMRSVVSLNSLQVNHFLVPMLYIITCAILIGLRRKSLYIES
ncbi:MAG: ABC transporter permease [Fervidobacterium sp.]